MSRLCNRELFALKKVNEDLGIEIEVESSTPLPEFDVPSPWRATHDGSLVGYSAEYVSVPIRLKEVEKAVLDLNSCLKNNKLVFSNRTSTHVHVNVQELNVLQTLTVIAGMWMMEPLLFKFTNKNRKGNLFCLGREECSSITDALLKDMERGAYLSSFNPDMFKYSATNLCNIPTIGTIENRMLHGTNNPEIIKIWCEALFGMKNYFSQFESPSALGDKLFDTFTSSNPILVLDFLEELLPPELFPFYKDDKEASDVLSDSYWSSCDILFAITDWDTWEKRYFGPKEKKTTPRTRVQAILANEIGLDL